MIKATNLDSWRGLLAIIIPATVAIMMPFLSPVVVGGLVDTAGWTEKDAGLLVSTEMGVLAWSGLAGLLWLNKISWKLVSLVATSLMLAGNLTSVFWHHSHEALLASRIVAGTGAGTLTALAYGSLARSVKPHRNYGLYSMSQMSMAMLFLAILPVMIAGEGTGEAGFISSLLTWLGVPVAVGIKAFYVIMVGLSLSALALSVTWFPLQPPATVAIASTRSPALLWIFPVLMLIAIFTLMLSHQAFWTYSERIGSAAGLNRSSIGTVLAFGALAGLLGAGAATMIGNSLARSATILLIFAVHIASLSCFLFSLNIYWFALGVFLHKFAWNFTIPYQLGMLAEVEKSGKAAVLSTVVTSFGISAGAGFAAYVVADFGYRGVILGAMGFACIYPSLMLLMHIQLSGVRSASYTSSPAR